jgi:hypothetical protein
MRDFSSSLTLRNRAGCWNAAAGILGTPVSLIIPGLPFVTEFALFDCPEKDSVKLLQFCLVVCDVPGGSRKLAPGDDEELLVVI